MHEKTLIEFIARYTSDRDFRCRVLHREADTMKGEFKLDAMQFGVLTRLEKQPILDMTVAEFEALGVDIGKIHDEIHGPKPKHNAMDSDRGDDLVSESDDISVEEELSASAAYEQGKIHLRGRDPHYVHRAKKSVITLRGQGFNPESSKIEVYFVLEDHTGIGKDGLPNGKKEKGTVLDVTCGLDVFQRVRVETQLDDSGQWSIFAKNTGRGDVPDWSLGNENSWVHVIG